MTSQIALFLRVALLYPLAGALALLPGIEHDSQTQLLTIDLDVQAGFLGALIWGAVSGGTFGLSRLAKRLGWAV